MKTTPFAQLHDKNIVRVQRAILITRILVGVGMSSLVLVDPAMAQSLKDTGVKIFNVLYGLIAVIGGISMLVCLFNWTMGNWMGSADPKKNFMWACVCTGGAFGVVGIIQFIKEAAGGSGAGISSI